MRNATTSGNKWKLSIAALYSVSGLALTAMIALSTVAPAAVAQDRKWGEPVNLGHVHKAYGEEDDASSAATGSSSSGASSSTASLPTGKTKRAKKSGKSSNNQNADSLNNGSPSNLSNSSAGSATITNGASNSVNGVGRTVPNQSQSQSVRSQSQSVQSQSQSVQSQLQSAQSQSVQSESQQNPTATGSHHKMRSALKSIGSFIGTGSDMILGPAPGSPQQGQQQRQGFGQPQNAPAVSGGYDPKSNFLTPPQSMRPPKNTNPEGAMNFSSPPHSRGPFSLQGLQSLNRSGNWNEMLDYSRAWIAKDPNSSIGWFGVGQSAYKLGNYDAAVAGFLKATQLTPKEPRPYNNLSAAYCKREQWDFATKAIMDGAWYSGNNCTAYDWYVFGNAFKDLGLAEAAEHAYRRALAKQPNFPEAQNNLGVVLYYEGDTDSADSWYQRSARGGNKLAAGNHRSIQEARAAAARAAQEAASSSGADQGFYSPSQIALRRHQYQVATSGQGKGYGE
ncbi:MAG TPA: tetratricopeptide repeat protein [Drouetiella sp.]